MLEIRVLPRRTPFSARGAREFYLVWNVVSGSMYQKESRVGEILRLRSRALVRVTFPKSQWYFVRLETEKCGGDGSMVEHFCKK